MAFPASSRIAVDPYLALRQYISRMLDQSGQQRARPSHSDSHPGLKPLPQNPDLLYWMALSTTLLA